MDPALWKPKKRDEGTQGLALFESPRQAPCQPVATSERAAEKVSETLPQRRRDLLLWMLRNRIHGATDNELLNNLVPNGWSPNGVRPRRIELFRGGWLEEAGERAGSIVWRPSEKAMVWYETLLRGDAA